VIAALRNQFGGHAVRVADAIESQVAAETMKSVAPGTPSIPATQVQTDSAAAAEQVMSRTQAAEDAAEGHGDASRAVKDIQGTAQDIYKTGPNVQK